MNAAFWAVAALVMAAAAIDIRTQSIPNWLTGCGAIGGLAAALAGLTAVGIGGSVSGVAAGAAIPAVLWFLGGLGGGDVKLCAAVGAWIGPEQLILAFVVTGIAGGLMAIGWAAWNRSLGKSLDTTGELLRSWKFGVRPHATLTLENAKALRMPYGPAIAAGTLFSFLAV